MMEHNRFRVIGMMSGTSLDGIDLSDCTYYLQQKSWKYQFHRGETYPYSKDQIEIIRQMEKQECSFLNFHKLQISYTQAIVAAVQKFIISSSISKDQIDFISIHGHTIFHDPSQGITKQAGNLSYLAAKLGMDVIGNFREFDVHSGAQGAPLAPFGEELFSHNPFLNLGGVANIGYNGRGTDIVYCNLVLNHLSNLISGADFDQDGELGRKGVVIEGFNHKLKSQFRHVMWRSLAREGLVSFIESLHEIPQDELVNVLRTYYEFLSEQIVIGVIEFLGQIGVGLKEINIVCTGGGSYNRFLLELMNQKSEEHGLLFSVGDAHLVQFKEAIIFGYLGLKYAIRMRNCETGVGGQMVKGRKLA